MSTLLRGTCSSCFLAQDKLPGVVSRQDAGAIGVSDM